MFEVSNGGYFGKIASKLNALPKLELWDASPEGIITDIRYTTEDIWITSSDYGAISINCHSRSIFTYPIEDIDFSRFMFFFNHNWLPLAYQICGTQVIHASAVANKSKNQTILFCGEGETGKSTLAFGLARRKEWFQIADDRIAFAIKDGKAKPQFIPDSISLRPPSANFFGEEPFGYTSIKWDDAELEFSSVFFLGQKSNPDMKMENKFKIHQVSKADAYHLLLKQAFSLTPVLSEVNKKILKDYLVFANQIKAYKIIYPKDFDMLDGIFDELEEIIFKV